MLFPKKVNHRKWHKGTRRGLGMATRTNDIDYGDFALKSLQHGWVGSREIESARRVLTRYIRRGGQIWIRVFPDKPVTKKGNETPMGGGKGSPDHFVAVVKPGTILFEMSGITPETAKAALEMSAYKLRVKAKYIQKI
jgi:large subunit ribosomal protein L16